MKKIRLISLFSISLYLLVSSSYCIAQVGQLFCKDYFAEKPDATKPFIVLKDGTKLFAEKVDIGGNGLNAIIIADNKKYQISDISYIHIYFTQRMGFSQKYHTRNLIYTNLDNNLYETLVLGEKISVFVDVNSLHNITTYKYFYIKNGGKSKGLNTVEDIYEAVADCKSTSKIKNYDFKDLKEECKLDKRFLTNFFEQYNLECK